MRPAARSSARSIAQTPGDLRVGTVPYLVGRPLDFGLERENGFSVERLVPAELVRALRAGDLDVALVSSIELFRRPGYRYLDGLAVSGEGSVASVQVFLRRPLEQVRRVALDPSSEAAATLVRILLSDASAPREFFEVAPGSDPARAEADAWLEIGDPALRRFLAPDSPPVFNPSQEWAARTGLPFAFAVWIVRPGVALRPSQIEAFARARARGAARIAALAEEASRAWELPREACLRYLAEECRYEPGPRLEPALTAFRDAAAALELARGDLAPEPIAVPIAQAP
jgi:chorismate dehydratase